MENATLQLFEYLLATQNSNTTNAQDLNEYPAHWFLDEILTYTNVELKHSSSSKSRLVIYCPKSLKKPSETSEFLAEILRLLQYDDASNPNLLISDDGLEKNLILELETVNKKILASEYMPVLINEWQQLLLGINNSQISSDDVINTEEDAQKLIKDIVAEYKNWKFKITSNETKLQNIKEQALYDWFTEMIGDTGFALKLKYGVGVLYIPGDLQVSHPLLTMDLEVTNDKKNNQILLTFANWALEIDPVLEYVLFNETDISQSIKSYVAGLEIDPFDHELIAIVLQKISQMIAGAQYFATPEVAISASVDTTQILHLPVIYAKDKPAIGDKNKRKLIVEKQKSLVKFLTHKEPSDVVSSIVNPKYVIPKDHYTNYRTPSYKNLLYPWPDNGIEQRILNSLDFHNAVTVLDQGSNSNDLIINNFLTHLIASGNRVLVVGESATSLDEVRARLPEYFSGLHTKLANNYGNYQKNYADLQQLIDKKAASDEHTTDGSELRSKIQLANAELTELIEKIVDFRELGSKKNFWQGDRYYTNDKKFGNDPVAKDLPADISSEEAQEILELRPYFTPENMELLNYEFININELENYHGYEKLLILEKKYLEAVYEHAGLEETFDESTDIRFFDYLYEELPKLMREVAEIKTSYGNKILKKSLLSDKTYQTLATSLGKMNIEVKDAEFFDATVSEKEQLIEKLNKMLDLQAQEMSGISTDDSTALWKFYQNKKTEMTDALRTANSVLTFNTKAMDLSKNFKGILADGLDIMNILYEAVSLHLMKIELDASWQNVKNHFLTVNEATFLSENIYPSCQALYELLKSKRSTIDEFKVALFEIENILKARNSFVIFAEFVEKMGSFAPTFTAALLSEENPNQTINSYFEKALSKEKTEGIIGQISVSESELLEHGIDYLHEYLQELQHKLIDHESLKNYRFARQDVLNDTEELFANEHPLDELLVNKILTSFNVVFMPLAESGLVKDFDANLFDLVIFIDATKSNVIRGVELMHAHKAILFGNITDRLVDPLNLRAYDFRRLGELYGETLNQFGQQYFNSSLFNLLVNSAAWDSQITLNSSEIKFSVQKAIEENEIGVRKCNTHVEDEIFDALAEQGYQVLCKVKYQNALLDFLVIGTDRAVAINVLGDAKLERDDVKLQLDSEVELRKQGLVIKTVQAAHFYLNSRKTLLELYEKLSELEIYPIVG